LEGLRVLDVTSSLAGPYCTEILAALGAEVVKVERPNGGDETRQWWPSWHGDGVMFLCANAGKRSLALDLTHPDGFEALLPLVDQGTGLWAALGILAALRERDATGRGRVVEVSLYETAVGLLPYHLTGYLATGEVPGRHGTAYPAIVPYQTFAAADGELMVAA